MQDQPANMMNKQKQSKVRVTLWELKTTLLSLIHLPGTQPARLECRVAQMKAFTRADSHFATNILPLTSRLPSLTRL